MRLKVWRLAIAAVVLAWASAVTTQSGAVSLDQGWTAEQRTWFYTTTQGSQLLPYSWYLALEQPGGGAPFNADHLSRYGYLENRASNPDNLPLGFVKDLEQDQLGLTCAACHTNEVTYAGKTWRIDGAPTDADTWAFLRDLGSTLQETAASQSGDRYKRFAAKVTARTRGPEGMLYADLKKFSEYFTKFVDSSRTATAMGDREWRDLLARHNAVVRRELARFRGEERDTAGDGFFATFDGPGRAIRCALAVVEAVRPLGLELRAGVHTGECELHEEKVAGVALSVGARICGQAGAGEVFVSRAVKDLVAGSGLEFAARGLRELKGVGEWELAEVTTRP